MGCCLSKSDPITSSPPHLNLTPNPVPLEKPAVVEADEKVKVTLEEEEKPRKEVGPDSDGSGLDSNDMNDVNEGSKILAVASSGKPVRTSSCTNEEVDEILIQCGRLSRSSSVKRYSGSKRSYDFEGENEMKFEVSNGGEGEGEGEEDERLRRRQSRGANRRRSNPSRSRERLENSSRRVSRSPQRRSMSPMNRGKGSLNGGKVSGKMVTVPATVGSLSSGDVKRVLVKRNVGSPRSQSPARGTVNGNEGDVKRVLVKRNVGSPRSHSPARGNMNGNGGDVKRNVGSPRSQSPARGGVNGNEGNHQLQQLQSLSGNGSRKVEHLSYRRTPLNEIDLNSLPFQPLANKSLPNKGKEIEDDSVMQNKYAETTNAKVGGQGTHRRTGSRGVEGYEITKTNYCRANELHTPPSAEPMIDRKLDPLSPRGYDAMVTPVTLSGSETFRLPQTLMRSPSSRRSRDLDINVDALLTPNPTTNYNSLLLQDIQNFHQKNSSNSNSNSHSNSSSNSNSNSNGNPNNSNNSTNTPDCSILEAVADLNSSSKTNLNNPSHNGKKRLDGKDPDDLVQLSIHKYVTVRKRGDDLEDEESSGSNSFVGGVHQNSVSPSSWELNSADSTDCWTSKSYSREGSSPIGFQRLAISDMVDCGLDNEVAERKFSKNVTDKFDHQQLGTTSVGRSSIQTS